MLTFIFLLINNNCYLFIVIAVVFFVQFTSECKHYFVVFI